MPAPTVRSDRDVYDRASDAVGLFGRRCERWLVCSVNSRAGWSGPSKVAPRALFRQRLQPIELAKAAARAMQSQRLVGPDGIEVPNAFSIALHPDDLAELAPYQASLETRIARYLSGFADERRLIRSGPSR